MKARRHQKGAGRPPAGMALSTVLVLIALVSLTFLTLANLSTAAVRLTSEGRDRVISLSLAEAGIDDAVDRIRADNAYPGTSSPITLYEDASDTKPLGTFAVQVTPVSGSQDLDVYSTGTTTNGKRCQVRARVKISDFTFDDGAMLSNGDISVSGVSTVETSPLYGGNAHVRANGNITFAGAAHVDGRVAAVGTVSLAPGSSTDRLYPSGQPGAARVAFPARPDTDGWKARWIADAKQGATYGAITGTPSGGMTITGPAYVDGDIQMDSGHTLEITGSGPVYVNGNLLMQGGSTLRNRSTLIVRGRFEQSASSGSPVYEADPSLAPTPPALIALTSDPARAIRLTPSGTDNLYALIYAVNGGIEIAPQGIVAVRGALVAGGKGALITVSGNYRHVYPDGMTPNNTHLYPDGMPPITQSHTPPKAMSGWEF